MANQEDKRYLLKRGRMWQCSVNVPRNLHAKLGAKLQVSLGTDSLKAAQSLRWSKVAEFQKQIEDARTKPTLSDDMRALLVRKTIGDDEMKRFLAHERMVDLSNEKGLDPYAGDDVSEEAANFAGIVFEGKTPVGLLFDEWSDTLKPLAQKTAYEFRTRVQSFLDYCKKSEIQFLTDLSDHAVIRWRDKLAKDGLASATLNKSVSALSNYFRYLEAAALIPKNYAAGKSVSVTRVHKRERFEIAELVTLLQASTGERRDLTAIAAVMGARLSELHGIRASDVHPTPDGLTVTIAGTKTAAAHRLLPVPELLRPAFERRMKGKKADEYLFTAADPAKLKMRGQNEGRDWSRWARRVLTNRESTFHELRNTAAFLLETAGVAENTAARILGHSAKLSLSYGLYSGASDLPTLRAALEASASKLPPVIRDLLR